MVNDVQNALEIDARQWIGQIDVITTCLLDLLVRIKRLEALFKGEVKHCVFSPFFPLSQALPGAQKETRFEILSVFEFMGKYQNLDFLAHDRVQWHV